MTHVNANTTATTRAGPAAPTASSVFSWRPAYELGEPTVDAQHHQLLELAALLHEAAVRRRLPDVMAQGLRALRDYADGHFDDEEDLFARIGSPLAADHKAQHDALRHELATLSRAIATGDPDLPDVLVAWVETRLIPHMVEEDQRALAAADALWGKAVRV